MTDEQKKKIKKLIKPKKYKKITKKIKFEKKLIKPIIIFKKPTGSVWFRFDEPETEKT